ncbi:hypothetical protein [Streptomyces chryseus]
MGAAATRLPVLSPMLASVGPLPGPEEEAQYAYETLWNGARVLIRLPGDGSMQLVNTAGLDVTADYSDLTTPTGLLPQVQASSTTRSSTSTPPGGRRWSGCSSA